MDVQKLKLSSFQFQGLGGICDMLQNLQIYVRSAKDSLGCVMTTKIETHTCRFEIR